MNRQTPAQNFLKSLEHFTEQIIFASRWLLAPFYIGLAISIVVLLIKFLVELLHLVTHAFTLSEPEVIVGVLSLVDIALTGSLLIIVIFSGYENFVSRIDHAGHKDWPAWMGTIDFSALKLKLLSSIVAISAIQLLKQFMALNKTSDRDLYFLIVIHVVFVASSVLLALADRIAAGSHGGDSGHGGKGTGSHRSEGEIMIAAAETQQGAESAAHRPGGQPQGKKR